MRESFVKTSVRISDFYLSVEPDEEEGLMELFVERRFSDKDEDIKSVYAVLTPDEMEYLAKRILDAVDYFRKQNNKDCVDVVEEYIPPIEEFPNSSKEKLHFITILSKHNGDRKAAARELGISDRTFYRKLKLYNLD